MNEEIIMVNEDTVEQEVEQIIPDETLDDAFVKKVAIVGTIGIAGGIVFVTCGKRIAKKVGSWIDNLMAKHLRKKGWEAYTPDECSTANEDVEDAE